MPAEINIITLVYLLGTCQGVLLSILLWTKYRKLPENKILGWLILSYSIFVFRAFLFGLPDFFKTYPHLMELMDGLPFLFGPLHLMYVGRLTNTTFRFAKPHWLHFAPFIVYRLYFMQAFFISRDALNQIVEQCTANNPPLSITLSGIFVSVLGLVYMVIALIVIKAYAGNIRLAFSSLEKINLTWLRYFTLLALLVWMIVFIDTLSVFIGIETSIFFFLVPVLTALYVYAIGYIGMFKTEIFSQKSVHENIEDAQRISQDQYRAAHAESDNPKYKKSGLTEAKADEYLTKLLMYIGDEEAYTNPEITLRDVSEHLDISPHNISEVINSKLNQNFYDFINQYRLEKVKKDLLDQTKQHLTILGIAFDAGFNSKSGFNAIFKRFTGRTPKEYRDSGHLK